MTSKLFFLDARRRPKFRPPLPYPETIAPFEAMSADALETLVAGSEPTKSDFMLRADFGADAPAVQSDLMILIQDLFPLYRYADERAKYYQNEYYKFQWILLIGSLVTSIIGALTIALSNAQSKDIGNLTNAQWLGIGSVLAGAVISIFTGRDRRRNSQSRWYLWRRVSEELRRVYFMYLAHVSPFDGEDCRDILQAKLLDMRQSADKIEHNSPMDTSSTAADQSASMATAKPGGQSFQWTHTKEELQRLLSLYMERRLKRQKNWYGERIIEYEHNSSWVFDASLYLAVGTSVFAFINTLMGVTPFLSVVITLMPVVAAYIASFERIYGWERQATLYFSARQRLEKHELTIQQRINDIKQGDWEVLRAVVRDVEDTFDDEVTQWGSKVDQTSRTPISSQEIILDELKKLNLPPEQKKQIESILGSEQQPSTPTNQENKSDADENKQS